ncbi:MAG: 30S ribosomal protein S8 [Gemmatimonadota bacterium]
MSLNDPIADLLTRVRNACQAGHRRVDMPVSKLKAEIARVLAENGFIHDYKVLDDGRHGVLRLYLKYTDDDRTVIRSMQRVSKPGRRRYVGADEVPKVRNGLGVAILTTSHGVMSDHQARQEGVGGEVLAEVY